MSKVIIIVGGKGTGKTTKVKELISKVNPKALLLNDVNNEYSDIMKTQYFEIKDFTNLVYNAKGAVAIFEEATIFFSNRGGQTEKMKSILVRSRHTKNFIILVFHSLRSVPKDIFDLINLMIIFKTNDNISIIEKKFEMPELVECVQRIKANPNKHYNEAFEPQGNFTHD